MITAELDRPKLERSLKQYSKQFGESNAQAVIRWSVQACRELAFESTARPANGMSAKQVQQAAMFKDAMNVILVVDTITKGRRGGYVAENQGKRYGIVASKVLADPAAANGWIEVNRTKRNARTAELPISERKVCDRKVFQKAMKTRFVAVGMAKGAWLGAGMDIARAQTGMEKMAIGKNYLSYTQKHSKMGSARKPSNGWKPVAGLTSTVGHSSDPHVLRRSQIMKAINFGLSKTVKWYAKAIKRLDK